MLKKMKIQKLFCKNNNRKTFSSYHLVYLNGIVEGRPVRADMLSVRFEYKETTFAVRRELKIDAYGESQKQL